MDPPSEDKQWATKYLLDPLTAPGPSDETGPGSHFTTNGKPRRAASTSKAFHHRSSSASNYPTPPTSASPTKPGFDVSHRKAAFGTYGDAGPSGSSPEPAAQGRRRGSSLSERYRGDMSHRPLDVIRKETKAANRAPHLKKAYMPGADVIDSLDKSPFGLAYHHEGPYDATLLARNRSRKISPVEATSGTNREALRATPREHIRDALDKKVPLQGTATIPPGMHGMDGKIMNYEEGADLMREPDAAGGAYKRWEGIKYLPEDYKGKGEPSFSLERAIKQKDSSHRRIVSQGNAYEMQPRSRPAPPAKLQRSVSSSHSSLQIPAQNPSHPLDSDSGIGRSNTTGRRVGEGLKRRFGSLRRSLKTSEP